MVQQVEEQHVEDEERFRKLQIQDTANLNDRLDSLIVRNLPIRFQLIHFKHITFIKLEYFDYKLRISEKNQQFNVKLLNYAIVSLQSWGTFF